MHKNSQQNGVAMLEMAIALPVVLILLIGVVDLSMAIDKYIMVSRATYEAVRFGAKIKDLPTACMGPACKEGKNSSQSVASFETMNNRIVQVMDRVGLNKPRDELQVTIEVTNSGQLDNDQSVRGLRGYSYKQINATVQIKHNAIFPLFNLIPIKTTISFSDLFKDNRLLTSNQGQQDPQTSTGQQQQQPQTQQK